MLPNNFNSFTKHIKSRSLLLQQAIKQTRRKPHLFYHLQHLSFNNTPKKNVPFREKCTSEEPYYQYNYRTELELAVNEQIFAEQQAAQNYLNMAVFFLHPSVSRQGTGGFFMNMYEEEIGHMKQVIQYQLLRGGRVQLPALAKPPFNDNLTLLGAFKLALQMEKTVTESIVYIINVAEKVKDHQCMDFFASEFLTDQNKSVSDIAHHVTQLNRLSDEQAQYIYDLKLAKSHPYSFKKIDTYRVCGL